MTQNKRHRAHYDALNDERIANAEPAPITLPVQAYGSQKVEWPQEHAPVWVWISWPHKPAERVPARVLGFNDRVCVVEWDAATGVRNTVVWRNAVTLRENTKRSPHEPDSM